jgi:hypothetical protein
LLTSTTLFSDTILRVKLSVIRCLFLRVASFPHYLTVLSLLPIFLPIADLVEEEEVALQVVVVL